MKAIFDNLKELQEVYSGKLKLEKEIQDVYVRAENNKEVLARLKEREGSVSARLSEVIKEEKALKVQSAEVEANREKTEFRIAEIKTQREYEALEKEIKAFSTQESTLRKELEMARVAREEVEADRERLVNLISAQEEEMKEDEASFASEIKSKESSLSKLTKEEENLSKDLSEDLKFKFKRIVRKKDKSIVPMRNNVCTGCNISLPVQFANDVRREEEIHFCPNCNRILFFEDAELETDLLEVSGGLADLVGDLE